MVSYSLLILMTLRSILIFGVLKKSIGYQLSIYIYIYLV